MASEHESRAQIEVWQWKEEAWKEVAALDLRSAIRKRLEDSEKSTQALGFSAGKRLDRQVG